MTISSLIFWMLTQKRQKAQKMRKVEKRYNFFYFSTTARTFINASVKVNNIRSEIAVALRRIIFTHTFVRPFIYSHICKVYLKIQRVTHAYIRVHFTICLIYGITITFQSCGYITCVINFLIYRKTNRRSQTRQFL